MHPCPFKKNQGNNSPFMHHSFLYKYKLASMYHFTYFTISIDHRQSMGGGELTFFINKLCTLIASIVSIYIAFIKHLHSIYIAFYESLVKCSFELLEKKKKINLGPCLLDAKEIMQNYSTVHLW